MTRLRPTLLVLLAATLLFLSGCACSCRKNQATPESRTATDSSIYR